MGEERVKISQSSFIFLKKCVNEVNDMMLTECML